MIKQYIVPFVRIQKRKQLLMKVISVMYLNQFILPLYETSKTF